MNELLIGILLCKRVIERVRERGTLTADEKAQIFQIFQTIHLLSCRVFNKLGQAGQLLGELEVPRVQDCDLKEECAYSDNE
jgi:hypothetical protein